MSQYLSPVNMVDSIAGFVLNLTVEWFRDRVSDKLSDGDMFDQMLSCLLGRELHQIKRLTEAQQRQDVVDAVRNFHEGLRLTVDSPDAGPPKKKRKSAPVDGAKVGPLLNNDVKLSPIAKKKFGKAADKAGSALALGTLSKTDRIAATNTKIMATLIEAHAETEDFTKLFYLCLDDLKDLHLHTKKNFESGLAGLNRRGVLKRQVARLKRKSEILDREIVWSVCRLNRHVFDLAQQLAGNVVSPGLFFTWPWVQIAQEETIDPLRNKSLDKMFRIEGWALCSVVWTFGKKAANKEVKLKSPSSIATNAEGCFIVVDNGETKIFDNTGQYLKSLPLPTDGSGESRYHAVDVDVDENSNVYLLVSLVDDMVNKDEIRVFDKEDKESKAFELQGKKYTDCKLAVDETNVFVLNRESGRPRPKIEVYETKDGKFAGYLAESNLVDAQDIACGTDGRIFVLDKRDLRSENKCIRKLNMHRTDDSCEESFWVADGTVAMAFHRASGYLIAVSKTKEGNLLLSYHTTDGESKRTCTCLT